MSFENFQKRLRNTNTQRDREAEEKVRKVNSILYRQHTARVILGEANKQTLSNKRIMDFMEV